MIFFYEMLIPHYAATHGFRILFSRFCLPINRITILFEAIL